MGVCTFAWCKPMLRNTGRRTHLPHSRLLLTGQCQGAQQARLCMAVAKPQQQFASQSMKLRLEIPLEGSCGSLCGLCRILIAASDARPRERRAAPLTKLGAVH
jgi:hypothetical protein